MPRTRTRAVQQCSDMEDPKSPLDDDYIARHYMQLVESLSRVPAVQAALDELINENMNTPPRKLKRNRHGEKSSHEKPTHDIKLYILYEDAGYRVVHQTERSIHVEPHLYMEWNLGAYSIQSLKDHRTEHSSID